MRGCARDAGGIIEEAYDSAQVIYTVRLRNTRTRHVKRAECTICLGKPLVPGLPRAVVEEPHYLLTIVDPDGNRHLGARYINAL